MLSAIPKYQLSIAKQPDTLNKLFFWTSKVYFPMNELAQINFDTARSRDFYKLLVSKIHAHDQTGPKYWSENLFVNQHFQVTENVCRETRLREFQF